VGKGGNKRRGPGQRKKNTKRDCFPRKKHPFIFGGKSPARLSARSGTGHPTRSDHHTQALGFRRSRTGGQNPPGDGAFPDLHQGWRAGAKNKGPPGQNLAWRPAAPDPKMGRFRRFRAAGPRARAGCWAGGRRSQTFSGFFCGVHNYLYSFSRASAGRAFFCAMGAVLKVRGASGPGGFREGGPPFSTLFRA